MNTPFTFNLTDMENDIKLPGEETGNTSATPVGNVTAPAASAVAPIASAASTRMVDKEELKRFYRQDLLGLVRKIFLEPFHGTYDLFVNRSEKSYFHSLVLIATAGVLCMVLAFFALPSAVREYAPWFSIMTRAGISAVLVLLLISACSFGIKLISGKPSFRNELLTGGLCAIPLMVLMLVLFIASKMIMDEQMLMGLAFGGFQAILQKAGFVLVLVFYVLLLFINILQQSLRAAGTSDLLFWWLSPVSILLSFYLTIKMVA